MKAIKINFSAAWSPTNGKMRIGKAFDTVNSDVSRNPDWINGIEKCFDAVGRRPDGGYNPFATWRKSVRLCR